VAWWAAKEQEHACRCPLLMLIQLINEVNLGKFILDLGILGAPFFENSNTAPQSFKKSEKIKIFHQLEKSNSVCS
jgi:hypothetical protein